MTQISARLRIHFNTELAIGPGRIELLEGVQNTGSLAEAARAMHMSYRRAWLLMRSLNESLTAPATIAIKGGRSGGGATVTPLGRALIKAYRRFEAATTRAAAMRFRRFAPPAARRVRKLR